MTVEFSEKTGSLEARFAYSGKPAGTLEELDPLAFSVLSLVAEQIRYDEQENAEFPHIISLQVKK